MIKKHSCIIVDDDEVDRLTVIHFAKQSPFLEIVGSFETAESALEFARTSMPDIMFLDIDMDGLSGIELRERLMSVPVCIFISSYPEYAAESFEMDPLDFIVKPVKSERFDKTMAKIEYYLELRHKAALLDHNLGGDTIFIKDGHQQVKLNLHEIVYLEALRDYTSIVTSERKYSVLASLSSLLEQQAFQNFVRIHRSYAVQKHYISKLNSREVFVNGMSFPVGRTYRDALSGLTNDQV